MTAIQRRQPLNLLFSLPDVLMIEIFEFDTTYRVFNTLVFRKELHDAVHAIYLKKCKSIIVEYVLDFINDEYIDDEIEGHIDDFSCYNWHNEYGYIIRDSTKDNVLRVKYTEDNFEIYLHSDSEFVYYKILPKSATKDTCDFLRNPRRYDGLMTPSNVLDDYNDFHHRMPYMDLSCHHVNYALEIDDLCLWN